MARNKAHKQRHASKHAIARRAQGRVVNTQNTASKKASSVLGKSMQKQVLVAKGGEKIGNKQRIRMMNSQRRATKNKIAAEAKELGTKNGPPIILGMLPLNESANTQHVSQQIQAACGAEEPQKISVPITVVSHAHKRAFTLLFDETGEQHEVLDTAKIADILVMTLDISVEVQESLAEFHREQRVAMMQAYFEAEDDEEIPQMSETCFADVGLCITEKTREILSYVNSQGALTTVVVLQGLNSYANPQKRDATRRLHERYFAALLPKEHRVLSMDTPEEVNNFMRTVSSIHVRRLAWREQRPYFVADDASYDEKTQQLSVSGFLRGSGISPNLLIHITDFGTYEVVAVKQHGTQPSPLDRFRPEDEEIVEVAAEEVRDTLEMTRMNETEFGAAEGLPTEGDVEDAIASYDQQKRAVGQRVAAPASSASRVVMVPEGTSDYQAAWYEGSDIGLEHLEDQQDFDDHAIQQMRKMGNGALEGKSVASTSRRTAQTDVDHYAAKDILRQEEMTAEEREAEIKALKEEAENEEWFEDEVDWDYCNENARDYFRNYRGMKTFAHGAWDPKEMLPPEYARIFSLHGYSSIKRDATAESKGATIQPGAYVTVVLKDVPPNMWENATNVMLISGLLRHEYKWSVQHFHVQRHSEFHGPIRSKAPMFAHCGFRKFFCEPIYSDVSNIQRTKYARFFQEGDKFRIASIYGPICYHPCPVLFFAAPGSLQAALNAEPTPLCSFGGALPPNADFLILKRAVLTGKISVVHKKQLVIKYMFFNPEDVQWFKPVDLYTKLGRRGKILKPLGQQGLFKATFNDVVQQHDVPMMDLWVREFPSWKTKPLELHVLADMAENPELYYDEVSSRPLLNGDKDNEDGSANTGRILAAEDGHFRQLQVSDDDDDAAA